MKNVSESLSFYADKTVILAIKEYQRTEDLSSMSNAVVKLLKKALRDEGILEAVK